MGESSSFRRSFSDRSGDPRMGDAIPTFADVTSLRRFMFETLARGKWSSFSQNFYLKEAQKLSKPGSVAQKKAYFEALYKRIASKKAADAEAPPPANNLPEPETSNEPHNTSSDDFDTVKDNSTMILHVEKPANKKLSKSCFSKSSVARVSKSWSPTIPSPFRFRTEERAAKRKEEKPGTDMKIPTTDSSQEMESSNPANKNLSVACGSKSWSPTIPSPFRFRTEERVSKRKEKLEELKMMRNSVTFRPGCYNETDSPGNQIKKTPWSPKLGRKHTPSVVQDRNSRPPRMSSSRPDSSKPPATEKNKLLQPKKISQENASPNIQL